MRAQASTSVSVPSARSATTRVQRPRRLEARTSEIREREAPGARMVAKVVGDPEQAVAETASASARASSPRRRATSPPLMSLYAMMRTSPRSRCTPGIVFSRRCARTGAGRLRLAASVAAACRGPCSSARASARGVELARRRSSATRIRVDAERKLLPWSTVDRAVRRRGARSRGTALETKFPVQDNGLPTYLAYSRFDPDDLSGVSWPHNPAGLYAMLTDSAVLWYAFSGDRGGRRPRRDARSTTSSRTERRRRTGTGRACPTRAPNAGDVDYRGADDEWCDFCGRGDGVGVIEPDKVGELGLRATCSSSS